MQSSPAVNTEPEFDKGFHQILRELNTLVASFGRPVAGNYLYNHGNSAFPDAQINPVMRGKRENLLFAARDKHRVLEIGCNAGHSALLVLYHCPDVVLHTVDICLHPYTKPAMEFLKQKFPKRLHFYPFSSLHILPYLAVERPKLKFDMIHIDGNHEKDYVLSDFYNSLRLIQDNGWVLFDDTGNRFPDTQAAIRSFIERGMVEEIDAPHMDMHKAGNKLVRVLKTSV